MKSTIELYYESPDTYDFDANVISVSKTKSGIEVILDKTAFFPEAGGQVCDKGTINNFPVLDVRKENDIIIHLLPSSCDIETNDSVRGCVDRNYHFDLMQQHTSEHIMSGLVHKLFGYDNVGFHLSENTCTMDFNGPLSDDDILKIERLTNEVIQKNLPVKILYPTSQELSQIDYRAKLDEEAMGKVRLIDIEGIDICACCAPHLSSTGQIGLTKIIDYIKYKGGMRITIASGMRAILDYSQKHKELLLLSHTLSTPVDKVPEGVSRLQDEIFDLKEKVQSLEKISLDTSVQNAISIKDIRIIFSDISDKLLLRNTINSLMEESSGYILAFNGNDTKGYSFILASKSKDVLSLLKQLSESLNIKGGGKNPMVSGSCRESYESILNVLNSI